MWIVEVYKENFVRVELLITQWFNTLGDIFNLKASAKFIFLPWKRRIVRGTPLSCEHGGLENFFITILMLKSRTLDSMGSDGERNPQMTSVKCKIVIVGDSECGKTSLIQRYIKENFNEVGNQPPSLSISFFDLSISPVIRIDN